MRKRTFDTNDNDDKKHDTDNDQTYDILNIRNLNDKALQAEILKSIGLMATEQEQNPRMEDLPTLEQFPAEQVTDQQCFEAARTYIHLSCQHRLDHDDILPRQSLTDESLQRFVSTSLCRWVMYVAHYQRFAGHPQETWMYDKMRQHHYWLYMLNDVYKTVRQGC